MNEFGDCDVFNGNVPSTRMAASAWVALVLLICLGASTPVMAGERSCQIEERPVATLTVLEPVRDRVRGGHGRTREHVYITPPLEHDSVQLRLERTDGSNDGYLTVCIYDDDASQATQVRISQEQVWAYNSLSLTRGTAGEWAETPPIENVQGRRLMVKASNPRSTRRRSFSYRLSLQPTPSQTAAPVQAEPELDDDAQFCGGSGARPPLTYGNLQRLESRFPHEQQYFNPMAMDADQVRVELEPAEGTRERRRSPGGVLVFCDVRGPDHPQGAGTSVRGIVIIPSGRDFKRDDPLVYTLDGYHQAGMMVHMFPMPYEASTRRRWASRLSRGGVATGAAVFTGGGAVVAGGALAGERLLGSLSSNDDEGSKYPLVTRLRVEPIRSAEPDTVPKEDIGTVVHPNYQPETTPDDRDDQERLRASEETEARDERGQPAPQLKPLVPTVVDTIAFGPMQADEDDYFRAPTTAPVGSLVPVEITYDDRRRYDNVILVRADAPDSALRRPSGRNSHVIRDADTVYRRAGDTPGIYEIRLRRHAGADRRIMARQQIELVDIDIDLQVPDAVARGRTFEVHMDPVMDGHLVITSPDRGPSSLVRRSSRRNNAIEDADGPGVFTRRAPRDTGQHEVRFHFNPSARWQEETGREGRLMARATLNVVDADSLGQVQPDPDTTSGTETEVEPVEPVADAEAAETLAADLVEYSEDCVGFNPQNLEIQPFGDGGARLLDGSHALMAFSSTGDANDALEVIQHYGFNRSCYVGRPNPSMHYFLVDGNAPEGGMNGEDCLRIDPDRIEAAHVRGSWKLVQGSRWLMDFADSEEEARQALWVVRHHGFTRTCYVARPDPALTYMRR